MPVTPETVVQRSSVKKMFLNISQNLQEYTYGRAFFHKAAGHAKRTGWFEIGCISS